MKLAFFDDYKLGVVKGDSIVDVSSAARDIPHLSPADLINGLIARFDQYPETAGGRIGERRRQAVEREAAGAPAKAGQHRLHGRELYGERHPQGASADQRVP